MSTPFSYTAPDGLDYKVERAAELNDEFGLQGDEIAALHRLGEDEVASGWYGWSIAKLIFGILPVVPKPETPSHLLRVNTIDQTKKLLDLSNREYDAEWVRLRKEWTRTQRELRRRPVMEKAAEPTAVKPEDAAPVVEVLLESAVLPRSENANSSENTPVVPVLPCAPLDAPPPVDIDNLTPETILSIEQALAVTRRCGFGDATFDMAGRDAFEREAEILWFAKRLLSVMRIFDEPMAAGIGRQALVNELTVRRCDDLLLRETPDSKRFGLIQLNKTTAEQRYEKQWEQLEDVCPYIKASNKRTAILGTFCDLVEGVKEWETRQGHEIFDGLFSALGVQIELRTSLQAPEPRYRPGWVLHMREAMQPEALWDSQWQRKLPLHLLKAMDDGLRNAIAEGVERGWWHHTDLEAHGPAGEYPALEMPVPDSEIPEVIPLADAP